MGAPKEKVGLCAHGKPEASDELGFQFFEWRGMMLLDTALDWLWPYQVD